MKKTYAALHRHTTHSIYDGFMTPEEGVKYAKALGYPALAMTDHGNFNGAIEHYLACKKHGVHPVIGVESYFQPAFTEEKRDYHMTILAKNTLGYQHMCQIISYANQHQWAHRHGVVTFPLLKKYHEGLIVTTGCIGGIIPQHILAGKMESVHALMQVYSKLFGDDFVVEVMPFPVYEHQQEIPDGVLEGEDRPKESDSRRNIQKEVNEVLLQLAEQYHRRVIMTDDAHYVSAEDYESYLFMQEQVAGKKLIANYENLYLHSPEGMAACWSDMMGTDGTQYMQNAVDLALSCQVDLVFDEKKMIPRIDWGIPSSQKLIEVSHASLQKLNKWTEEYQKRLQDELDVVLTLGFEDYFLLCWDLIEFAKRADIATGYGRGSVCNSLLGYALGLTQVDPVFFGMNFERFLRIDKKILPDVDMDFDPVRREEIIAYLMQRYNGSAYPISNFTYYKAKLLINDMAKHFPNISSFERDRIKNIIDGIDYDGEPLTYEELLRHNRVGVDMQQFDEEQPGFLEQFTKLYGEVKNIGKHAAGIALAPDDITKYVPIIRVGGKADPKFQTGYDMKSLGEMHVLKLDALGVDKVSVVREVEKKTDCHFTYTLLNDPKPYWELAEGKTDAVFQFSSFGMRRFLRQAKPNNFVEMYTCNALFRPGASASIPDYINSKFSDAVRTDTPWYEYTKETNGVFVFDEQKMLVARHIGHMEWPDVDKLMKQAKKGHIDDELREKFTSGAMKYEGLNKRDAVNLIEQMSRYSFNKGHAVGYSLLAHYSLWQRMYYPLEYYAAVLRHEGDDKKRTALEASAVENQLVVLLPHVNGSGQYEVCEEADHPTIQAGLSTIPNVGGKAVAAILRERARNGYFENEDDFLKRMNPPKPKRAKGVKANPEDRVVVNKRVVDALLASGALEFDPVLYEKRCMEHCSRMYSLAMQNRKIYEDYGNR